MPLMSARRSFVSIACLCGLACSDPVITAPAVPLTSPNAARGSADDYTFVLMDPNPDVLDASGSAFAVNNRGQATGQGGRFAYGFVWTERSGMQSLGTLDNASAGQDVNEQGVIVGFGVADHTRRNIWALFVAPGYERREMGRSLLKVMVEWLFEMGSEPIWLTTEPGTRAERFYVSAGWCSRGAEASGEVRFELLGLTPPNKSPERPRDR